MRQSSLVAGAARDQEGGRMTADTPWLMLVVVVGVGCGLWTWRWHGCRLLLALQRVRAPRRLRPRTPADCPACRPHLGTPPPVQPAAPPVRPWRVQPRRGAPKRIRTAGFACPNPTCPYVGITDEAVHALVGFGHHGRDRIQDYRCQACGTKVSSRRDTPLYRLKTPAVQVSQVLTALAEGVTIGAAGRVFGHGERTIATWLARGGEHARRLHVHCFRGLHLPHLQLDELRTRLRDGAGVRWLWLAVDPRTKVIPALYLGRRTQAGAQALVHTLAATLAPGCIPAVTSDGLALYFGALTAHFGHWVAGTRRRAWHWEVAGELLYGQVQKRYRRRRLAQVQLRMRWGRLADLRTALQALGLRGTLTTAFVERLNLTVRRGVAGLARRTWATAQSAPQLLAHLEWWRGYYHVVRWHQSLRVPLAQPITRGGRRPPRRYQPRTPGMALGVTDHRWTTLELLTCPLPPPWTQCA